LTLSFSVVSSVTFNVAIKRCRKNWKSYLGTLVKAWSVSALLCFSLPHHIGLGASFTSHAQLQLK
jgi:hypothetical protein